MPVGFDVTNQKASPALYASSLATRPAASFVGRLFVDTDTPSTGIYRDTGTVWLSISGGSSETQSLNDVCVIGNTTTTLGILINGQSTVGTHDSSSSSIPPEADFALTIGEDYPATGFSIYTTHKNHFAGVLRNEGTVVFDTLGGTGSRIVVASADGTLTASAALSSYVTGSGTTNYVPKFTSASAIGNSNLINDASGNLGLGVTPSLWNGIYEVAEIGTAAIFGTSSYNSAAFSTNIFYNSSNSARYIANDFSNMYWQDDGNHIWYNAPSGTAGNAITFTQAMTLFSTGNLAINSTTDAGFKFDCNGTANFSGALTGTSASFSIASGNQILLVEATTGTNASYMAFKNTGQRMFVGIDNSTGTQIIGSGNPYQGVISMEGAKDLVLATSGTRRLTISSTGAATFISSVTVGNFTTAQKNALTASSGMVVYDTTLAKLCVYTTAWETITSI